MDAYEIVIYTTNRVQAQQIAADALELSDTLRVCVDTGRLRVGTIKTAHMDDTQDVSVPLFITHQFKDTGGAVGYCTAFVNGRNCGKPATDAIHHG